MATREQLLRALKKADAAGDVPAAKAIARRLASMREAPTADVQAAPAPQAEPQYQLNTEIPDFRTLDKPFLPQEQIEPTMMDRVMAGGEALATVGTGMTTGALGYGSGVIEGLAGQLMEGDFSPEAAARTEQLAMERASRGTYEPRGKLGQEYAQNVGEFMEQTVGALNPTVSAGGNYLSQPVVTNRPRLSGSKAIAKIDPEQVRELPSDFEAALRMQGINPENLSPEMYGKIMRWSESPNTSPMTKRGLIAEAKKDNLKRKTGDTGLAEFKLENEKVTSDPDAIAAMDNGYDRGTVQLVKTSDPTTKKGMREALRTHMNILENSRNLTNSRTTDPAGNSLSKRIFTIRDKNLENRDKLDALTSTKKFREKPFDTTVVNGAINDIFTELDIIDMRKKDANGNYTSAIPEPNFKGSIIDGDKGSQKAIKELIRILGDARSSDSLTAHRMKRQLDALIDFRKKAKTPLGKEGKNALKKTRAVINEELRTQFPEYAKINDDLSSGLTALDDLFDNLPSKLRDMNLYDDGIESMLGQEIRVLFGNRQTRVPLENALYNIDDTAAKLGGKFDDSYKDLYLFSKGIEEALGNTLRTSFGSEIEQAVGAAMMQSYETAFLQLMAGKVTDKLAKRKARKQTVEAYRSMRELLERDE